MSYSITSVDYGALPAALLDLAKKHSRVDFPDDDEVMTEYLQWAIAYCERFWGVRIFAADVAWSPVISATASRYQCPLQPVASFSVLSNAVDVSAEYHLETGDPVEPVWLVHTDGTAFPADAEISLVAGVEDPADLDPGQRGAILRVAASLYENRETVSSLSLNYVPSWMNDLIGGYWIPRI